MYLFIRIPYVGEVAVEYVPGPSVKLEVQHQKGELCIHGWKLSVFLTTWKRLREYIR